MFRWIFLGLLLTTSTFKEAKTMELPGEHLKPVQFPKSKHEINLTNAITLQDWLLEALHLVESNTQYRKAMSVFLRNDSPEANEYRESIKRAYVESMHPTQRLSDSGDTYLNAFAEDVENDCGFSVILENLLRELASHSDNLQNVAKPEWKNYFKKLLSEVRFIKEKASSDTADAAKRFGKEIRDDRERVIIEDTNFPGSASKIKRLAKEAREENDDDKKPIVIENTGVKVQLLQSHLEKKESGTVVAYYDSETKRIEKVDVPSNSITDHFFLESSMWMEICDLLEKIGAGGLSYTNLKQEPFGIFEALIGLNREKAEKELEIKRLEERAGTPRRGEPRPIIDPRKLLDTKERGLKSLREKIARFCEEVPPVFPKSLVTADTGIAKKKKKKPSSLQKTEGAQQDKFTEDDAVTDDQPLEIFEPTVEKVATVDTAEPVVVDADSTVETTETSVDSQGIEAEIEAASHEQKFCIERSPQLNVKGLREERRQATLRALKDKKPEQALLPEIELSRDDYGLLLGMWNPTRIMPKWMDFLKVMGRVINKVGGKINADQGGSSVAFTVFDRTFRVHGSHKDGNMYFDQINLFIRPGLEYVGITPRILKAP